MSGLKILSVVTLVSPMGEYGGPTRVAVNQAHALRARGHDVTILGGARGFEGGAPTQIEGVPAALFPVISVIPRSGFAGLASPGAMRWLRGRVRDYDVIHVHVARDLITLPAAWTAKRAGVPYVLQPHGMIDPSDRALARPLDRLLTRPVLARARRVMYLTETERHQLTQVAGGPLPLRNLLNGVTVPDGQPNRGEQVVLYLARLARRKRPRMFVEMASRVGPSHPGASFVMVGPDEGEGQGVEAAIAQAVNGGTRVELRGPVPPERTHSEMAAATIFVLPSVDEPYPMSVLEAMAASLPVVITDSCGLAGAVRDADAGIVVGADLDSLVAAVDRLLADPEAAADMGRRGRQHVLEHLGMDEIARQLESAYAP